MVNDLVIGIYLNILFPAIPAWVFVVACIALVTVLNIAGIGSVAKASNFIVLVQFVFIAVFVVIAIAFIATGGNIVNLAAPFTGDGGPTVRSPHSWPARPCCACPSCASTPFRRWPRKPKPQERHLPGDNHCHRGCQPSLPRPGLHQPTWLPRHGFSDHVSAANEVMLKAGGDFLNIFFIAAYVAGATGSAIASQASVSRILFSMGRDGMLPRRVFGTLSARFKPPVIPALIVSVISVLGINADVDLLFSIGSFGALVAFPVVNLAVIKHYLWGEKRRTRKNVVLFGVLPGIGFLLTLWLWSSLSPNALPSAPSGLQPASFISWPSRKVSGRRRPRSRSRKRSNQGSSWAVSLRFLSSIGADFPGRGCGWFSGRAALGPLGGHGRPCAGLLGLG